MCEGKGGRLRTDKTPFRVHNIVKRVFMKSYIVIGVMEIGFYYLVMNYSL